MPVETAVRCRQYEHEPNEPQKPVELTPVRQRNFARVFELVSGILASEQEPLIPQQSSYQPVIDNLQQSWHWGESIRSEISMSQISLCTQLDLEQAEVFNTSIDSTVQGRGSEEHLIFTGNHLQRKWNLEVVERDHEQKKEWSDAIKNGVVQAKYDLDDADDIVILLRKDPTKVSQAA